MNHKSSYPSPNTYDLSPITCYLHTYIHTLTLLILFVMPNLVQHLRFLASKRTLIISIITLSLVLGFTTWAWAISVPDQAVIQGVVDFEPNDGQVGDPVSVFICFNESFGLRVGWHIRVRVDGELKEYAVCSTLGPCGITCELGQTLKFSDTLHTVMFFVNVEDTGAVKFFEGSLPLEFNNGGGGGEICDNGVDDDGDGLIDCDDSDCPPCPSEVCDNGIDDDGDGLVDCGDPDCVTEPACTPGVEITRSKMVSPTELGMAVKVWFPEDSENNRRFVKFKGTINGQPIEKEVDVTRYTEPGQEVEIGLDKSSLLPKPPIDGKTPLRIGLQGSGVPRFNENERFELTAVAYTENGPQSEPDTKEVEILLPVIFVHGYDGPSLLVDIIGDFVIFGQKSSLFTYLYKATSNEDFTTGYEEDAYWTDENKNSKRYRTLWFEHYRPRVWSPARTCVWLDKLVGKIQGFTWADRVNIVSHSTGGLVGRYYVTKCNGTTKVDKVIMIGTPNKGSSNVYIISDSWSYSKIRQTLRKGLAQWLIPTYQALYDTNGNLLTSSFRSNFPDEGPPENVTYYSIYTTEVPTAVELTVRGIGRKPLVWYDVLKSTLREGDGTVPELSARLDFTERVENIPLNLGILHINLVEAPEVQAEVLRALRE